MRTLKKLISANSHSRSAQFPHPHCAIIAAALLLPLAFGGHHPAVALEPVEPTVMDAPSVMVAPSPVAGIEFDSSTNLNQTSMIQNWVNHEQIYQETGVTYRQSSCSSGHKPQYHMPSSVYGPTVLVGTREVTPYRSGKPRVTAFFASKTTPPAPGLRVVIQNQTVGGETLPYSDREYDSGRRSEKFLVSPADEHKSKYLAVLPGDNLMAYQIKRGNQIVESGEFRIAIDLQNRQITRTIVHPREVITLPCVDKDSKYNHKGDRNDRHHDRYDRRNDQYDYHQ